MENALWLMKNADIEIDNAEVQHAFNYNPHHPYAIEAKNFVLTQLQNSKKTSQSYISAVDFLFFSQDEQIADLIDAALKLAPESEYVIEWAGFKFELLGMNTPYKQRAIDLYKKRNKMPWRSGTTYQFEILQEKFGKILVPNWLRKPLLFVSSLYYPELDFDRSRRLARLGMLLLNEGSQAELSAIEEEILPLLSETISQSWYFPLIAEVFNFLAIMQLRRGNLTMARYYLSNNIEHKADSQFSFLFDCKSWIAECRTLGFYDFSAKLLEEKGSNILSDPEVQKIISHVRNGKDPWPKFADLDESLKIEQLVDSLNDYTTPENQLKLLARLPYLFLSQGIYESLTEYYKLSDWVPTAQLLTSTQKLMLLELDELIRNPPSDLDFMDPIPPELIQKNAVWILITEKAYKIVESLKTRPQVNTN